MTGLGGSLARWTLAICWLAFVGCVTGEEPQRAEPPGPVPAEGAAPEPEAPGPAKPAVKQDPKPEPKPESKPEPKAESKPEPKAEPKAESKPEPETQPKAEPKPDLQEQKKEAAPEPEPAAQSQALDLDPLNASGVRPVLPDAAAAACPPPLSVPAMSRKSVYDGVPFKPGELARYEVKYAGVLAGHATVEVRKPTKIGERWHRVFHAEARTGDWYKAIFVMHDFIHTISRPWDFGIARYYMKQDEGRMFGSRFQREKWIDFDHGTCQVKERVKQPDKPEKTKELPLVRGANDVLGAYFNIRARNLRPGVVEYAPVYTSEKNWLLEATPVGEETVEVPAGTFRAMKIKLKTYIGQELQQKGDVTMWVATDRPQRPMVQVRAEIKVGSIWVLLKEYRPGD